MRKLLIVLSLIAFSLVAGCASYSSGKASFHPNDTPEMYRGAGGEL